MFYVGPLVKNRLFLVVSRGRPIIGLADYRRRYEAFYRLSRSAILKTDLPIIFFFFFFMQTNILFTGDIIYW